MSAIDTIEGGYAELSSSLSGDGPYTIHGVCLKGGDITRGKSKTLKKWTKEALSKAAHTLKGANLVKNHNNKIEGILGEVTDAKYVGGKGLIFEAELDSKSAAERVSRGRLDVSARLSHPKTDELEEDRSTGAKVIDKIHKIINLSLVSDGASESNYVQSGPAEELAVEELAAEFDDDTLSTRDKYMKESDTKTESKAVYDDESGELKLIQVESDEELSESLAEDEEIEELRAKYQTMKRADKTSEQGGAWSGVLDSARGELVAALKAKRDELDSNIRDFQLPNERDELTERKRELNAEIEELVA